MNKPVFVKAIEIQAFRFSQRCYRRPKSSGILRCVDFILRINLSAHLLFPVELLLLLLLLLLLFLTAIGFSPGGSGITLVQRPQIIILLRMFKNVSIHRVEVCFIPGILKHIVQVISSFHIFRHFSVFGSHYCTWNTWSAYLTPLRLISLKCVKWRVQVMIALSMWLADMSSLSVPNTLTSSLFSNIYHLPNVTVYQSTQR
jgi:hypothetical protein